MADHAYVAFLDILGYKELLDADLNEGTQTFKDRMTKAYRTFESVNNSRYQNWSISDSIFISCTDRSSAKEFLIVVRNVYVSFLKEGLLIRGGVSFGQHFQTQSITYSPVLTKAYLLEHEVAQFPRIMVDTNILDMFPELRDSGLILRTGTHFFLNVVTAETFDTVWAAARAARILSNPVIQKNEQVRIKHRWLQDYLIEAARKFGLNQPEQYLSIFDEGPVALEITPLSGASNLS
jgi:hypothetical protein